MDEVYARAVTLPPGRLRALSVRRDGPGLVRATVQLGLLGVGLALALAPTPALAVPGFALASLTWGLLFGALHETSHRTAFRSRALNEALFALTCALHLFTPTGFRDFHGGHHRHTHDPHLDPEIAAAPDWLGAWPRHPIAHLALLTGVHLVVLKLALLLGMATGHPRLYATFMPWVAEERRARVAWEARGLLFLWAVPVGLAAAGSAPAALLLLVQLGAHAVLAPLLMAEHHGLPGTGDVLGRTRSTDTLPALRWLFWNMSWHAEHHGWPSVPFHALPALHAEVADRLPVRAAGYLAVHRAARG